MSAQRDYRDLNFVDGYEYLERMYHGNNAFIKKLQAQVVDLHKELDLLNAELAKYRGIKAIERGTKALKARVRIAEKLKKESK